MKKYSLTNCAIIRYLFTLSLQLIALKYTVIDCSSSTRSEFVLQKLGIRLCKFYAFIESSP